MDVCLEQDTIMNITGNQGSCEAFLRVDKFSNVRVHVLWTKLLWQALTECA